MAKLQKKQNACVQGCLTIIGSIVLIIGVGMIIGGLNNSSDLLPLMIFGGVLSLVGIGLIIGGLMKKIVGMKINPPEVVLPKTVFKIGEQFRIDYSQQVRAPIEISSLTIGLYMQEKATYSQGSSSTTVTYDHPIDVRQLPARRCMGTELLTESFTAVIPKNSMHSFSASNNEIRWLVRVHVAISGWPDSKEEYPIEILPDWVR